MSFTENGKLHEVKIPPVTAQRNGRKSFHLFIHFGAVCTLFFFSRQTRQLGIHIFRFTFEKNSSRADWMKVNKLLLWWDIHIYTAKLLAKCKMRMKSQLLCLAVKVTKVEYEVRLAKVVFDLLKSNLKRWATILLWIVHVTIAYHLVSQFTCDL